MGLVGMHEMRPSFSWLGEGRCVVHSTGEEHPSDLAGCPGVQGSGAQESPRLRGASRTAFGDSLQPVVTILVDVTGVIEALAAMMELMVVMTWPHEEEIMRWEDDGGAFYG